MDENGKASNSSTEISMVMSHAIITIHEEEEEDEEDLSFPIPDDLKDQKRKQIDIASGLVNDSDNRRQKWVPETSRFVLGTNKPPRNSLSRSSSLRPKSRFGELSKPFDASMYDYGALEEDHLDSNQGSPSTKVENNGGTRGASVSPKTPSPGEFGEADKDEEIYKKVSSRKQLKYRKLKVKVLIEWILFLCIVGCLVISLTVDRWQSIEFWDLRIWRWCVLVLVTFSGMLVTDWLMRFVVLLIELNYMLKTNVLYFVHGLKKSIQVCIWLAVVLLTWVLLFQQGVKRSRVATRVLDLITWSIVSLLIASFLWVLKTLLLKILASSFHVSTFLDRVQDSIFHQYILKTLSGLPIMESSSVSRLSPLVARKGNGGKKKKAKKAIDMNELHQMKQDKVSAWTMKMLVDVISSSGLTTLSDEIETAYDEQTDREITNEEEAIAAAFHIFRNVAKPHVKYIDEHDLRRFMIKEEVEVVFPMIDVAETGQIDRKTLIEWVLKVYKRRKALGHALNDTKTAVKQLNKLVTGVLIVIMIVVWLLLIGVATTKVLLFLSSQLVVAAFVFGNTCRTIFEAIIFVFIMHPFDVGDRCVIDGVQLIVEEMNILTTIFLRGDDYEKIYFPNSVLATKSISNIYRSPDMCDVLDFSIDFKTPFEKIGLLKEKIKEYLEKNPHLWHANHNLVVKEIEDVNKIKMFLLFNHTMNFQDYWERLRRRTHLVLEMKKIFEDLSIGYDLLPQQVNLVDSRTDTARS